MPYFIVTAHTQQASFWHHHQHHHRTIALLNKPIPNTERFYYKTSVLRTDLPAAGCVATFLFHANASSILCEFSLPKYKNWFPFRHATAHTTARELIRRWKKKTTKLLKYFRVKLFLLKPNKQSKTVSSDDDVETGYFRMSIRHGGAFKFQFAFSPPGSRSLVGPPLGTGKGLLAILLVRTAEIVVLIFRSHFVVFISNRMKLTTRSCFETTLAHTV